MTRHNSSTLSCLNKLINFSVERLSGEFQMDIAHFLGHPIFRPYQKKLNAGEFLFKQGTMGDTMFIVLEGRIRLLSLIENEECCIAIMGPGQFLGERALVNVEPYCRRFSAQAITPVTMMELGHTDIMNIEKQAPYIKKMILTRSLEVAEERLDRANSLVRVLRPKDLRMRVLQLLEFIAKSQGLHEQVGTRLFRLKETVQFYVEIEKEDINAILNELIDCKILQLCPDESYLLLSEVDLKKLIEEKPKPHSTLVKAA